MNNTNPKIREMREKGWKLVRDDIWFKKHPEYVDARFILLQTNEEYIDFVRLKIEEKFIEVIEAGKNPRDKNKVIEEIADLREIISIAVKLGLDNNYQNLAQTTTRRFQITEDEIKVARIEKLKLKGGFDLGIIMYHPNFTTKS